MLVRALAEHQPQARGRGPLAPRRGRPSGRRARARGPRGARRLVGRAVPDRRLDVLTGQVGQAGDGWVASDGGVGPVVVVLVEPSGKGLAAGGFAGEQPSESPPGGHGAVEAFDLAIGLWAVGPGPFRCDRRARCRLPATGWCGRAQPLSDSTRCAGDAAGGEPGHRPAQHPDRGGARSRRRGSRRRPPGVVVEHGVDVGGGPSRLAVAVAGPAGVAARLRLPWAAGRRTASRRRRGYCRASSHPRGAGRRAQRVRSGAPAHRWPGRRGRAG